MSSRSNTRLVVLFASLILLAGFLGGTPGSTLATNSATTTASASSSTATANGTVDVHFINVGQSVSTLIVGPTGETMLVDTGHYNDDGQYVLAYLQAHDIDRIDYLVSSHSDADHIGGHAAVIEYVETEGEGIGAIYDSGIAASTQTYAEYLNAVEEHNVTLYETREGDSIPFEGANIQVLGPPDPYLANEDRNENSLVLKLTYGETSFLFTGDAEDDQEAYLIDEYGVQLHSTVLSAGHHGSATSSSGEFLDTVQPEAVVISSAYDSPYDHPSEATLQRLADRSLPVYWTASHGNIVLVSDGTGVSVQTQQAAPTDPLTIRDADPIELGTSGDTVERDSIGSDSVRTSTRTVAADGGTPTSDSGALAVTDINADAAGDDRENLNDEHVVFENTGADPLALSGWTVEDEAGHRYTFPDGYTLPAGETVTLRTGTGPDTATELYWGSGSPIWNNNGDTVTVRNSDGDRALQERYE